MRIYFVSNGFGYGHVSRDVELAKALRERGHEVVFSTYGDGLAFLRNYDFEVIEVEEFGDVAFTSTEIQVFKTVRNTLRSVKPGMLLEARRILRDVSPDVMLVDGYVPAMVSKILRSWRNMRIFLITNETIQWKQLEGNLSLPIKKLGEFAEAALVYLANEIIVPDFPPPYGVCLENLAFYDQKYKFHFVGPMLPELESRGEEKVVVNFGGSGVNPDISEALSKAEEVLGEKFVVARNMPRERYMEHLAQARVLVTHGGHTSIMEALACAKPIVGIPIKNYPEREGNLRGVERLGVGRMLDAEWVTGDNLATA
ncbi:glycosyltransferase, partial [Candidatus Pyrohabitans sp.]